MLIVNTLSFLSAIEAFSRFQSSGTFLLYLQEHLSNNLLCHDHVVYGLLSPHFFKILFPDQDDHYRHLFTCFWSRYSASSFSSVTALLGSAAIPAVILILIVIMALATMILVILMIVITTSTLQRNKDLVAEPLSRRLAESWEAETSRWFQVVAWWRVRCLWIAFIFVIVLAICTVTCSL